MVAEAATGQTMTSLTEFSGHIRDFRLYSEPGRKPSGGFKKRRDRIWLVILKDCSTCLVESR